MLAFVTAAAITSRTAPESSHREAVRAELPRADASEPNRLGIVGPLGDSKILITPASSTLVRGEQNNR